MNKERNVELETEIARSKEAVDGLRSQIETFKRHKTLLNEYLDGTRKSPFDDVSLRREVEATSEYITNMHEAVTVEMDKVTRLREQLDYSAFLKEEQEWVIHLTPKKVLKPTPGV